MILKDIEKKINEAYARIQPKNIYKDVDMILKLKNYLFPFIGIFIISISATVFTLLNICVWFTPFSIFIILYFAKLYDKKYHELLKQRHGIESKQSDVIMYEAFKKAFFDTGITEREIRLINKKLKYEQEHESSSYSYKSNQFVKGVFLFYLSSIYFVLMTLQLELFLKTKTALLQATILLFIVPLSAFIYFNIRNMGKYSKEKTSLWLYYIELEIEYKKFSISKNRKN